MEHKKKNKDTSVSCETTSGGLINIQWESPRPRRGKRREGGREKRTEETAAKNLPNFMKLLKAHTQAPKPQARET